MGRQLQNIQNVLLLGAGPSCVPDSVYAALSYPVTGPRDPDFIALTDTLRERLQRLFKTTKGAVLPLTGTGSAGMETCLANLMEPGDRLLILDNGFFCERMKDMAARLGVHVDVLSLPWGFPVLPEQISECLSQTHYDAVAMVHAETSTGVRSPVEAVGGLVASSGALFIVDCVTSLGGIDVDMDRWKADAVYSASQKCLSCPPGLAPLALSQRAVDRLKRRRHPVPSWFFDLTLLLDYWEGRNRCCHHTVPVNMLYGLHAALDTMFNEGLRNVFARHRAVHEQLVSGLGALGLDMMVAAPWRLPMLNVVHVPKGEDEAALRHRLLREHGIEIGGGMGRLAGKVWRIGLMGHSARTANVVRLLEALARVL